jgi:hypothetical protein
MRIISRLCRIFLLAFVISLIALPGALPQRAAAAPAVFSFNWNGDGPVPLPWRPGLINDWDLIVHNRDNQSSLYLVNAEHGADCSPFPAAHPVNQFQDSVYICRNHMMTALNGGGYSEIVMTPAQLLDFSAGGTVQVSASTAKLNNRDWIDIWISPFQENLLLPSGGIPPDLQGPTKDALLVNIDSSIPTTAHVQQFQNYVNTDFSGTGRDIERCVAPLGGVSASRRDPLQLNLSRTHVRLDVMVLGIPCTLVDTNINDLGFTLGVIQIGHHSYAPDEGTVCNLPGCSVNTGAGAGNTWHWSDFSMFPAVPFTMLRGNVPLTGVQANTSPTVNFAGAAPANSFLRFSALARRGSIQVSANGGAFFAAKEQLQNGDGKDGVSDGGHIGYWTPIPAGTTSVTFKAHDSTQPWQISDVSIWSSSAASVAVVPLPSPSPASGGGVTPPGGGGTPAGGGGAPTGSGDGPSVVISGGLTIEAGPGPVTEPAPAGGQPASEPGLSRSGDEPASTPSSPATGGQPVSASPNAPGGVAEAMPPPANDSAPGGTTITPLEVAQVSFPEKILRSQAFWPVAILLLVVIAAVAVRMTQRQSKRQRSRLKR